MTTDTRRRVKLYALNADRQWDDRGTGHVSSNFVERLKGISLLVRAEADGALLLESKIQPDTAYQKQQDTLIVWSEGDNFDLALSFQEKAGCDEIWEKICFVQGKDPSVDITQDIVEESEDERFEEMSDSAPPIELPLCELTRLEDISETIASGLTTPLRKEKLAMALESDNYIKKLLSLFHICEDLSNTEGLHHLYEIFKNIFLLNKNALFEIMFAEDTIFDVVGCLEYETSADPPKKHRQYLQLAKFREVIPIKNQDLLAKIHQTYRVQYIQDIILPTPSVFVEDNMLNTLSSFIFFNKVEIIALIQEDEKFLVDLFALLTDPSTEEIKRRDIVLFLKEFCNFAQNLQPQGKDSFYKTLTFMGVLPALEITLVMKDQKAKSASIDILTAIVEYSPCIIRNYTLQQVNKTDDEQMLINIAIEQMLTDSEPELGGAVQIMGVIRILLDPENMMTEKTDFLSFFYKHSIQTLIAPLLLNTLDNKPQNEDYQTVQLLGLVLELLSFCVEHHTYHIKNCILQKDLLKRILVLMKSTHTFLVLGALRLLRKIIALKDEFYNRHIVKGNLFAPVVDAFIRNNSRYNLLESAILEIFEFIKVEDIKSLCTYVVENFRKTFDENEYVQSFRHLKVRYDQQQEMLKERDKILDSIPMIRNIRYRRDQRQMEEEEEIWFNEEEDYTDVPPSKPDIESYSMMKNKVSDKNGPQKANNSSPPTSTHTHLNVTASNSPPQSNQSNSPPHLDSVAQPSAAAAAASATTTTTAATSAAGSGSGIGSGGGSSGSSGVVSTQISQSAASSSSSSSSTTAAASSSSSSSSSSLINVTVNETVVTDQQDILISTNTSDDSTNEVNKDVVDNLIGAGGSENGEDNSSLPINQTINSELSTSTITIASLSAANATVTAAAAVATDTATTIDVNLGIAAAVVTDTIPIATGTATATTTANPEPSVKQVSTGSLKKYLVDYEGDSDEEDDEESLPPQKKSRIV